ncbi:MAG: cell division protein ZipA [Chromatiaceae bacterium]|jgi:cell division protein ZipA|nr:cell division protein ZipA [Chromatiaceae bacterium]
MDPDLVRLILIVLGVLLVVGIYLWDRYKRSMPRPQAFKRAPVGMSIDSDVLDEDTASRPEPTMTDAVESIPEMRLDDHDLDQGVERHEPAAARSMLDPEPADIGEWSAARRDADPQFAMDLNFDAHGDGDYLSTDPALYDEVERKIIVIHIMARDSRFAGPAIQKACSANGLVLGDMSIYHRHEGKGRRVLFSMASMVEPGSFPGDDMAGFSTPGLSMFTQLPGVRDGIEIYEEMLATANRLASLLHGELQDEAHNKLTKQMEKHTRESIIEHRRRLKLARSRR